MTAWEITRKDLRLLVRDRRALAVLVVLPMLFIFILGMSTGKLMGWRKSNHQLAVGVIGGDRNEATEKMVGRLSKLRFLKVSELADGVDVKVQMEDKELLAVITIGPQFHE